MYDEIPTQGAKPEAAKKVDENASKGASRTVSMNPSPLKHSDYLRKRSYSPPVTASKLILWSTPAKPRERIGSRTRTTTMSNSFNNSRMNSSISSPKYNSLILKKRVPELSHKTNKAEANETKAMIQTLDDEISMLKLKI